MKAIFDKYKYILGLGLALVAVVIIAVVSAVAGKDAAENSGISYVPPRNIIVYNRRKPCRNNGFSDRRQFSDNARNNRYGHFFTNLT